MVYVSKYFHCSYFITLKQNLKIYDWINANTQLKSVNTAKLGEKLLNLLHNLDIATSLEERIETSQLLLFILKIGLAPLGKGRRGVYKTSDRKSMVFLLSFVQCRESSNTKPSNHGYLGQTLRGIKSFLS